MKKDSLYIGIDVGSTTIKAVVMGTESDDILWEDYQRHESKQAEKLFTFLERIEEAFHDISPDRFRVFITGSGGRNLADHIGARFIQEVNAVSLAAERLYPDVGSVIELGGQDSKIIIFKEDPATGKKNKIPSMNDKCAGGTGAVLDKINAKLHLPTEALCRQGYDGIRIHPVAGKCGVFAETDINGLQKQGVPTPELMASLFDAIVNQNLTVLTRGHTLRPRVLLLGGPNTFIQGMQEAWRHHIPKVWEERHYPLPAGCDPADLIEVPANAQYFAAMGSVIYGREESDEGGRYRGRKLLDHYIRHGRFQERKGAAPGLVESAEELAAFKERYARKPFQPPAFHTGEQIRAFIGLDGGSTSTKAVLMSPEKRLLAKAYQLSKGNPIEDSKEVIQELRGQVEWAGARLDVLGLVTTGYAKDVLRDVLSADAAIPETVAHTESALHYYDEVDVICDVGGQDIKIMILKDGKVKDFELNTQCSAGNGYFLQSTAADFGIPVEQYADAAFEAKMRPVFGYGCAVFMQTDIVNFQRQGWQAEEILAGLATVLPKNIWLYVAKMPNLARLGKRFILQGGTQHNLAAVKAQVDFINSRYRGQEEKPEIIVHVHCGESGAIGAALESIRLYENEHETSFIGLNATAEIKYTLTTNEKTRCHFCHNQCLRTFIDIETSDASRRLIVGNSCEKGSVEALDEMRRIKKKLDATIEATPNLADLASKEAFKGGAPSGASDPIPAKPWTLANRRRSGLMKQRAQFRIGIPRVHLSYSLAPLFSAYFESLGVRPGHIVYSDYTSEQLYREGSKRGAIDPCFPSKVGIAHVHNLLFVKHRKKPLDLIFYPMICNVEPELSHTLDNWICPSIMTNPEVVKAAFTKEEDVFASMRVEFLNTFLNLAEPGLFRQQMYRQFKDILGLSKRENDRSIEIGLQALRRYRRRMREKSREILLHLERDRKIGLVLLGRPYHRDPGINHGTLDAFQKLGYPILAQDLLPMDGDLVDRLFGEDVRRGDIAHPLDISDVWKNSLNDSANMKIWAAKFVARHPNLVGLELSNFRCGHDAPIYHVIEGIIECSGTPYFSFKDLDENKPAGAIKLRVETIDYFLKRYREDVFGASKTSSIPLSSPGNSNDVSREMRIQPSTCDDE